jgi:hypothetical protein
MPEIFFRNPPAAAEAPFVDTPGATLKSEPASSSLEIR